MIIRLFTLIINFIFGFAFYFLLPCSASDEIKEKKHLIFFKTANYQYDEPSVMTKASNLPFFGIGLESNLGEQNLWISNVSLQYGRTDYSGTGRTYNDQTYILLGQLGRKFNFPSGSFDMGFGVRYLYDDWGNKTTTLGKLTFDRSSVYKYFHTSLFLEIGNDQAVRIRLKKVMSGRQVVFIGHVPSYQNTEMIQKNGLGVDLEWSLSRKIRVFSDYWQIERSDRDKKKYGLFEPENSTVQLGLKFLF